MTTRTSDSVNGFSFFPQGAAVRPDTAKAVQEQLQGYSDALIAEVSRVMNGKPALQTSTTAHQRPQGDTGLFCGSAQITGYSKNCLNNAESHRFVMDFSAIPATQVAAAPTKGPARG